MDYKIIEEEYWKNLREQKVSDDYIREMEMERKEIRRWRDEQGI